MFQVAHLESASVFGNTIFENDILIRSKLAEIVFDNPEKLQKLNAIIHPAVKKHFSEWILNYKSAPFVIYEAAILFESGSYKNCDYIITVTAPIESRIERVIQRDKTTRENVLKRMNMQWKDDQRLAKTNYVIENINLESVKLEVANILKMLRIQQ